MALMLTNHVEMKVYRQISMTVSGTPSDMFIEEDETVTMAICPKTSFTLLSWNWKEVS
jgi:hypothetical protein